MSKSESDLTGMVFGRLTVIRPVSQGHKKSWECKCECGAIRYVPSYSLTSGNTASCGCSRKGRFRSHSYQGEYTANHRPRLYWTWLNMIRRCENPKSPDYYRYGELGISVCEEWHDLHKFLEWAYSSGWEEGLTIDRIDNNGNYCPENCRWADRIMQGNNKRTNVKIKWRGEEHSIAEWSRITGISTRALWYRNKAGWPPEDILTTPEGKMPEFRRAKLAVLLEYNGKKLTPTEWSRITGISANTIRSRYNAGWDPKDILTKPVKNV